MPNGVYPLFRFVDAKRDSAWTLSFSSPSLPVHLRFPLFCLLPSFFISFISHEVRRWPKTDCPLQAVSHAFPAERKRVYLSLPKHQPA